MDTIVFDKTGTLTVGNPTVAATELYEKDPAETLGYLTSVERESDHPLAKAVLNQIGETNFYPVEGTEVVKGGGIVSSVAGHRVAVGNVYFDGKRKCHSQQKSAKRCQTV